MGVPLYCNLFHTLAAGFMSPVLVNSFVESLLNIYGANLLRFDAASIMPRFPKALTKSADISLTRNL